MHVPYSAYYKPKGDLPSISSEQGGGLIIHHWLIIRTIQSMFNCATHTHAPIHTCRWTPLPLCQVWQWGRLDERSVDRNPSNLEASSPPAPTCIPSYLPGTVAMITPHDQSTYWLALSLPDPVCSTVMIMITTCTCTCTCPNPLPTTAMYINPLPTTAMSLPTIAENNKLITFGSSQYKANN